MRTRKNLNPNRRYSYEAMTAERDAAMRRLSKHIEKVSAEGLEVRERAYEKAQRAYARFTPSLQDGTRAENIARARAERRVVAANLFYATVERDAYKIVLNSIDPYSIDPGPRPHEHPRAANGTRSRKETKKLSSYRYRLKAARGDLAHIEHQLAHLVEARAEQRQAVERCAANTHLLQTKHATLQAEARMLRGPTARAPRGVVESLRDSRRQWREAYTRWQGFDRDVKRMRADKARKLAAAANYEQKILDILKA